jgi:hypothetical protein
LGWVFWRAGDEGSSACRGGFVGVFGFGRVYIG